MTNTFGAIIDRTQFNLASRTAAGCVGGLPPTAGGKERS